MQPCRLCGADSSKEFEATVLDKYSVSYYRCGKCRSLQTEKPYWLNEAYPDAVSSFDPDYLDRGLRVAELILAMCVILGLKSDAIVLDYGAGAGITTQRLRDFGLRSYAYDALTKNIFNPKLEWASQGHPSVLVASELFEHFPEPKSDVDAIFNLKPDYLVVMTCLNRGEGGDWGYLGREHGQHVFFFSPAAMAMLAKKYDYRLMSLHDVNILYKPVISPFRKLLIRTLLRSKFRMFRGVYGNWRRGRSTVL